MQLFRFALSLQLLLMLLIFSQPSQSMRMESRPPLAFIYEAEEVVQMVRADIRVLIEETTGYDEQKINEKQTKILQHFRNISSVFDQFVERYANISKKIDHTVVDHHLDDGVLKFEIESLVYEMQRISKDFGKMENLQDYDIIKLKSFTDWREPRGDRRRLLNTVFYEGMVRPLPNYIQNEKAIKYNMTEEKMCQLQLFPQHYLFALYMDVAITELKALILIEYSLMLHQVSQEDSVAYERNLMRMNYKKTLDNNHLLLNNSVEYVYPDIWRCDPPKHIHKVTYEEVTQLLQGYVENVVDLNTDGSCAKSCPEYKFASYAGCYDQEELCSQQPRCTGHIHDCQLFDAKMTICQSPENSTRRYEYIEYANGQHMGKSKSCQRSTNKAESWKRWLIYNCDYCFCLCDQQENSDRYFNLRRAMSDIDKNMVVTGVRFVKKNRIFHLQMQQGQLLPRGVINESTVEWKPIDDYKITDPNVTAGVDYHVLSYEHRSLNLDQVYNIFDVTYIVTGVGFQMLEGHLNLHVHYNKMDFVKGEIVDSDKGFWQFKTTKGRGKVNIENLDVPTRSNATSMPISKRGQYIDFTNTGMFQDAAQTTIPFIDIQDVVSVYPMPLSSIGLYYKGSPGFGGYVAPRIMNYYFPDFIPIAYRESLISHDWRP